MGRFKEYGGSSTSKSAGRTKLSVFSPNRGETQEMRTPSVGKPATAMAAVPPWPQESVRRGSPPQSRAGSAGRPDPKWSAFRRPIPARCVSPSLEPRNQRWRLRRFVVFVQARRRRRDGVAREQMSRAPRVFGGDHRHLAQHSQRAHGDVLEVADRRGDHEQRAGHVGGRVYCTIGGSAVVGPSSSGNPAHDKR